jgi:peroxiredoxin/uncharacterized membrane protein YphA (DoxX/SURF4 family)
MEGTNLALFIDRLVLAVVFLAAGLAKLRDSDASRQAMRDFGVPPPLMGLAGALLPWAELAVGIALVPVATAWWGAVGASTLLLVFTIAIAANLARGNRPACRCFGQISAEPIGASTVVRNLVLLAASGAIVAFGAGASLLTWIAELSPLDRLTVTLAIVATLLLAGLGRLITELLRQNGRLLERIEAIETRLGGGQPATLPGLPIGSPAPSFSLRDVDRRERSLASLTAGARPLLLVFADPQCAPCNALLPRIANWQSQHADQLAIAVVGSGSIAENRAKARAHNLETVLVQDRFEVADRFDARATPSAVLVRPDGSIGTAVASGIDQIEMLVAQVTRRPAQRVQRGQPAPPIELQDLEGRPRALREFGGRPILVIFWNPACGYCQEMLPELRAWEAARAERRPTLLVVSTGTPESNRALGLRAPVLLDRSAGVARAYGAGGTPMAVLVDGDLRIASDVAAGSQQVMALARG